MKIYTAKAAAPVMPPLGITDRKVKSALLEAVDLIRDETVRIEVIRALEANDIQGAIDAIRFDVGEAFLRNMLPEPIRDAYELAGDAAAERLSKDLKISAHFNLTNPRSISFAGNRAGDLIRDWGSSSKDALRKLITQAFEDGVTVQRTARLIMDSGIGLTERYALAVERYRVRLEDDPGNDYSQSRVDELTERYYDRLLRVRSESIARTEILLAENEGQRELWKQAAEDGLIPPNARRTWIATPSERTCDECMDMDGEEASLYGAYKGGIPGPPLHPMCRCAESISDE